MRYALINQARRARPGLSLEEYAMQMGALFAPFIRIAAANPYSSPNQPDYDAAALSQPGPGNRMIALPYPQRLVARDQVNQGAALLVASVGLARELGVPEERWVYLHGHADLAERDLLDRPDLGASPSARRAAAFALEASGITVTRISAGPVTSKSMHAIASMVERMRAVPGSYGFVGANGGFLSHYSVGIYSTRPTEWTPHDDAALQAEMDAVPAPAVAIEAYGWWKIES